MPTAARAAFCVAALAILNGLSAPAHAGVPLFTSISQVLDTNVAPQSIIAADFDSDSHQDLALSFASDDRVFLYGGLGDGSFAGPLILHDLGTPGPLCAADFDTDGHVDLAVSQAGDDYVRILFGTGTGQFDRFVDAVVTSYADAIAAADVNGDGSVDLAFACSGAVDVLINTNGGMTWTRAQYPFSLPYSLALADIDDDRDPDMLVGGSNGYTYTATVYRNPGDGQFGTGTSYVVGQPTTGLAVGDMTDDGIVDIVTPNAIVPGTGNANFGAPLIFETLGGAPLALADFDGDGRLDIIGRNYAVNAAIYLNQGNGSIGPRIRLSTGSYPNAFVLADFTGDGRTDAAFANWDGASISVLLASANALLGEHTFLGGQWGRMRHADMNADAREDLVSAAGSSVSVSLGNGDGTFGPPLTTTMNTYITALTIANMDADALPDVIVGVDDSVMILHGDGDGGLSIQSRAYAGHSVTGVAVGDINADGRLDLAVSLRGETYCDDDFFCWFVDTDSARALLATPSGGLVRGPAVHTAVEPWDVAVADLDGDGLLDLVTVDGGRWSSGYFGGDSISVFRGTGNGSFLPRRGFPAGRHPITMRVGDVTGDGLPDVVVGNAADTGSFYGLDARPGISTLIGLGNGAFLPPVREPSNSECNSIDLSDLDGDGVSDIVGVFPSSASVRVLLGGHNTPPTLADFFGTMSTPFWVTCFDATGDGRPDILVSGYPSDSLSLHRALESVVAVADADGYSSGPSTLSLVRALPRAGEYALRVVMDRPGVLSSSIHDVSGRRVATIVQDLPASGEHLLQWNGVDAHERPVASGVYVWRVGSGPVTRAVRVIVVR